jgi:hypothetical protein
MAKTVSVIGIDPEELPTLHTVVWLLRHPDPTVPALTKQAIEYLQAAASGDAPAAPAPAAEAHG